MRERGNRKNIFEEMVNFSPNLMKIMNTQIQEAQGILSKKKKNDEKWIKVHHNQFNQSQWQTGKS